MRLSLTTLGNGECLSCVGAMKQDLLSLICFRFFAVPEIVQHLSVIIDIGLWFGICVKDAVKWCAKRLLKLLLWKRFWRQATYFFLNYYLDVCTFSSLIMLFLIIDNLFWIVLGCPCQHDSLLNPISWHPIPSQHFIQLASPPLLGLQESMLLHMNVNGRHSIQVPKNAHKGFINKKSRCPFFFLSFVPKISSACLSWTNPSHCWTLLRLPGEF